MTLRSRLTAAFFAIWGAPVMVTLFSYVSSERAPARGRAAGERLADDLALPDGG
jgi:hypothetical protein